MRIVVKIIKWLLGLVVLAAAALFAWLYIAPPELIRRFGLFGQDRLLECFYRRT